MPIVVLFDFDGTIADTLASILRIGNALAVEFGYTPLLPEDIERLKHLTARQIIRQSGVPLLKIPLLLRRLRQELQREMIGIPAFAGIPATLAQLYERGFLLGVITSNSTSNVRAFLHHHGMTDWFSLVHSETSVLGKSRVIRRVIRQANWDPAQVVYVGDETRDIEAASEVGLKVIAVSWGFNSAEALRAAAPTVLISDPAELVTVLEQWFPCRMPTTLGQKNTPSQSQG